MTYESLPQVILVVDMSQPWTILDSLESSVNFLETYLQTLGDELDLAEGKRKGLVLLNPSTVSHLQLTLTPASISSRFQLNLPHQSRLNDCLFLSPLLSIYSVFSMPILWREVHDGCGGGGCSERHQHGHTAKQSRLTDSHCSN